MSYRLRHEDGTYRWIGDKNRVLRDESGQAEEIVGVWTDMDDGKKLGEHGQAGKGSTFLYGRNDVDSPG